MQGELGGTYSAGGGRWLAESTASFGCDYAFPATDTYASPYTLAPGVPLNMFFDADAETNPHFTSSEMSLSWNVRGGHIYAAFLLR